MYISSVDKLFIFLWIKWNKYKRFADYGKIYSERWLFSTKYVKVSNTGPENIEQNGTISISYF